MESYLGNKCADWIKDWFSKNGNEETKALICISGGKDSSIAAALCCKALGKDRVIGLLLPDGNQPDISDSIKLVKFLDIKSYTINISSIMDETCYSVRKATEKLDLPEQFMTNTPARIRMMMAYSLAQTIGNCRVINTCNLSENYIGWETYGGDDFGDMSPLGGITSDKVIKIGDELELPKELVHKVPSDGMCGKSDEDKFGFTYDELNATINKGIIGKNFAKIEQMHKWSEFKRNNINLPTF